MKKTLLIGILLIGSMTTFAKGHKPQNHKPTPKPNKTHVVVHKPNYKPHTNHVVIHKPNYRPHSNHVVVHKPNSIPSNQTVVYRTSGSEIIVPLIAGAVIGAVVTNL